MATDKMFRFVVGDATRTKIIRLVRVRALTQSIAFTEAKRQTGLNGTRVVFNNAIPRNRLSVQDNAGQMIVVEVAAPSRPQSRLGALYDLCASGEITGEQMIEAIRLLIGSNK